MNRVLERQVNDSKSGFETSREKELEGRKAEMEEMMNRHVFDEVPESEAVGKKPTRAKRLNDDRGERARRTSGRH